MSEVLNVRFVKDNLASIIYDNYKRWDDLRGTWKEEKKEIRQYVHATDTRKTSNEKLPWKNSTVTPKVTQIRDNLHANYLAALFPREEWFKFEPADKGSALAKKKQAVETYMRSKLMQQDFKNIISRIVLDYIDYGNAFVGHEFINEVKTDPITGEKIVVYRGPRAFRISPLDVVFDPTARSFKDSPLMVRRVKSIGDLEKDLETRPNLEYKPDVVAKLKDGRYTGADVIDQYKSDGFKVDGFDSIEAYFSSGMVELIDFYGDIYDEATKTFFTDRIITIADGRYVLRNIANPSWLGHRPIYHVGWRLRPDNLWAQGPLDQLVGMQYRIDHLENLKADVFDQIAHPVVKVKGTTVEEFEWGPGEKIYLGADGDVEIDRPDANALQADFQIDQYMARMEELAGAPKQAMGIRTPGEKTKYEVQVLENGAGRIFQAKVSWFEQNLIEPLINSMLEEAVRGFDASEEVKVVDPELGTETFETITKEDIVAKGKLRPIGARHFAEEARFIQELSSTLREIASNQMVAPHISGKAIAKAVGQVLGWDAYGIVKPNVAITEQQETQRLMNAAADDITAEDQMPGELQPEDFVSPEGEPTDGTEQPAS